MNSQPLILIVDDELHLRQLSQSDAESLSALVNRNRAYLREWLPWLADHTSSEDTSQFIDGTIARTREENGYSFGIFYRDTLIGVIGQHYLDHANRKTELGYWLDAGHQGRGIMTRATARLLDFAFNDQDCNRAIVHCAAGNVKSRGIPERLGFVKEGVLRDGEWLYDHFVDLVVYSMLKRDWRTTRAAVRQSM